MTTPKALALADALDQNADLDAAEGGNPAVCKLERDAAAMLRTQHAEIERKDALLLDAFSAMQRLGGWSTETHRVAEAITKELQ